MAYQFKNGKFTPYELPEQDDCSEYQEYLKGIGFHSRLLNWGNTNVSGFGVEVYFRNNDNGQDYLVAVDIGYYGHEIYVPQFPDLLILLNMLAPIHNSEIMNFKWGEIEERILNE